MDSFDDKHSADGKRTNMQNRFRSISVDLRRYIEKQTELVLLEMVDRLSLLMARSIHKFMGVIFLLFSYIFLMVALALYLGPLLGHASYGYLVVAGLTGVLGLTFAAVRPRKLSRRMQMSWMNQVFDAITKARTDRAPSEKESSAASEMGKSSYSSESNKNKN